MDKSNCYALGFRYYDLKSKDSIKILQYFLSNSEDVNIIDSEGRTPLHHALDNEKIPLKIIKQILDQGSNINARDNDGNTPLLYSAQRGFESSKAKCLLYHPKADLKIANNNGDTLLHKFASDYRLDFSYHVFKTILNAGVDINARNKVGRTPIFFSAASNKKFKTSNYGRFVPYLHKLGAKLDVIDDDGNCLLNITCDLKTVDYVLKHTNLNLKHQNNAKEDIFYTSLNY
jgi:ankyrin repeat protein